MLLWICAQAPAADFDEHDLGEFYPLDRITEPAVTAAADAIVDLGRATGFLISSSGHVLTNHHVVLGLGPRTTGRLSVSGRPLALTLVATDPDRDVALYRASATDLPYLEVRTSPVIQGEPVAVLGHPGGAPLSVSFGTVLTEDAVVGGIRSIEYSAQTWWGSSGSAVVDAEGRAVAVHWGWDSEGDYHGRLTGVPLLLAADVMPALAGVLACPDPQRLEPSSAVLARAQIFDRILLSIDGPAGCLEQIEQVIWHLHPTFEQPDVLVRDGPGFPLQILAWGTFELSATIELWGEAHTIAGEASW